MFPFQDSAKSDPHIKTHRFLSFIWIATVAVCILGRPVVTNAALTMIPTDGNESWDGYPPGTLYNVMQTMLSTSYNVNDPANRVQDTGNPGDITDQVWTITTPTATTALLLEIAGYKNINSFGIYNLFSLEELEIFGGSASGITQKQVTFNGVTASVQGGGTLVVGSKFGFYLKTPHTTFYSRMSDNASGLDQMVTQKTDVDRKLKLRRVEGGPDENIWWYKGESLLAWEDLPVPSGDNDYQDMVIKVQAVAVPDYLPVPEPTTIIAGALLLLPFGLTTIRMMRRRRLDAECRLQTASNRPPRTSQEC